ncbi:MAG: patatin-like phospholipase family protein [Bacillota bacterium]|nr:patatin-like phospholipase family protein [Bacillota bacterium]
MFNKPSNLVFEGGGVLGIAYLGVLQYLEDNGLLLDLRRTAGTSAGAITACLTSMNLPFEELKKMADSLDFRQVPEKSTFPDLMKLPEPINNELEKMFGDYESVYRLMNQYGWFSSQYFYQWIQNQINSQFICDKKPPPYTFADFRDPTLHKDQRPFFDLYVIGTNLSYRSSCIFSYETTPNMEVAEAVRISMSIPLFFEAVKTGCGATSDADKFNVFCDGGVMWNYPINLFDSASFQALPNQDLGNVTLGARFHSKTEYYEISNLLDYIKNLYLSQLRIQQNLFDHSPQDISRSIQIDTGGISPIDFDISVGDANYQFLYQQGYLAAMNFFSK